MAFDESIVFPNPPDPQRGQVYLSWTVAPLVPANSFYQVYIDGELAETVQGLDCYVGNPPSGEIQRVDIGAIVNEWGGDPWGAYPWASALGMEEVDYSADLPSAPKRRVELSWEGGTFEGADIAGFYVFGSDVAGGPIDYGTALTTITAYPAGISTSGWGLAPWGSGTWGNGESNYSWSSGTLATGVWSYTVIPFDRAGNQGTPMTASVTIAAPPAPPTDLGYTLLGWGQTTWGDPPWGYPLAVLTWDASPG